jgi:NADH-quinone oxidoreductase subunit N
MDFIIFYSFLPEIFLSIFILAQLVFNTFLITSTTYKQLFITNEIFNQFFFVFLCLLLLIINNLIEGFFSNFFFLTDVSSKVAKIVFLVIIILSLLPIFRSFKAQVLSSPEYFSIFLISSLASLLLFNSFDILSAYLLIEMQALSFYVLACFKRNSAFSTEAGLKYFISGAFVSGIFLLGSSIIYCSTGTLQLISLQILFSSQPNELSDYSSILIGVLLITFVFLFKLSSAPFHLWAPDVYEGSPMSSTIIFSILPKFVFFLFFIKWLDITTLFYPVKFILLASGILSVFFGSILALKQKRIKRLIIFSSIAQIGFIVCASSISTLITRSCTLTFLIIYLLTSILLWGIISMLTSFQNKICFFYKINEYPLYLSSFSCFFYVNKIWASSLALIFFSFGGIPPLIGFVAKLLIILRIIESISLEASFLLTIISSISVFYYLKIIKIIFFERSNFKKVNFSQVIFCNFYFEIECLLVAPLIFLLIYFFFYPSLLILLGHLIYSSAYLSII